MRRALSIFLTWLLVMAIPQCSLGQSDTSAQPSTPNPETGGPETTYHLVVLPLNIVLSAPAVIRAGSPNMTACASLSEEILP